ncbi:MAG: pur operon repressor [Eubacteriales bacterium]|nr:pur operon repressor [Eubacteriales bacterium]
MGKYKRADRIAVISMTLCNDPCKLYSLGFFAEMFDTAKSTISEDIEIVGSALAQNGGGTIVTVTGAAGGVKYLPIPGRAQVDAFVNKLCGEISQRGRLMVGDYVYTVDLLEDPRYAARIGEILALPYNRSNMPDFVITIETKGIPVALMTARALGVPLIVCRRGIKPLYGSLITTNYISGSTKEIETMSLPKRAIRSGQRGLIIDDYMRAGGSIRGIKEMMAEFGAMVVGVGVVMATAEPKEKMIDEYMSLVTLDEIDEENGLIKASNGNYGDYL